jgi:hypothetical protein
MPRSSSISKNNFPVLKDFSFSIELLKRLVLFKIIFFIKENKKINKRIKKIEKIKQRLTKLKKNILRILFPIPKLSELLTFSKFNRSFYKTNLVFSSGLLTKIDKIPNQRISCSNFILHSPQVQLQFGMQTKEFEEEALPLHYLQNLRHRPSVLKNNR